MFDILMDGMLKKMESSITHNDVNDIKRMYKRKAGTEPYPKGV